MNDKLNESVNDNINNKLDNKLDVILFDEAHHLCGLNNKKNQYLFNLNNTK